MTVAGGDPLRILMLLNRVPYPLNDGGAIAIASALKGYINAGCVVHVLAMNTAKHFVNEAQSKDVFIGCKKADMVYVNNHLKPFNALANLFSSQSYIISRFVSDNFSAKLKQILQDNDFDIIHLDTLSVMPYLEVIRSHSTAKVVYRAHNIEHLIWQRAMAKERIFFTKWYLKIQSRRLKDYETQKAKQVDIILSISRDDDKYFHALAPDVKVLLVPAGFEIEEEAPPITDNDNLFFIGSFDWLPNLQGMEWFFRDVWSAVHQKFPALKFVIAGKRMPSHILALRNSHVIPVGEVSDSKRYILDNGVMIVPLLSGSGIRIKIVEAMALGKVVIATTIAAEGLGITDGENILIANNKEEFIEQIGRCLNNKAFVQHVGKNAHTFALNNFQNKRIFQRLIATYRQLI